MPTDIEIGKKVRTMVPLWDDRDRVNARELPPGLIAYVVNTWEAVGGIPCVALRFEGEPRTTSCLTAHLDEIELLETNDFSPV